MDCVTILYSEKYEHHMPGKLTNLPVLSSSGMYQPTLILDYKTLTTLAE